VVARRKITRRIIALLPATERVAWHTTKAR